MVVKFEKEYLQELYEAGKTTDKKYRFPSDVVKQYQVRISVLQKTPKVDGLCAIRLLHYELLKGEKKGKSSILVNDKYRIELKVAQEAGEAVALIYDILK
jgi:proteic killer suppression protein